MASGDLEDWSLLTGDVEVAMPRRFRKVGLDQQMHDSSLRIHPIKL